MYNTYRTLVVVILYNKKIVDSLTIDSINDSSLENATLFVVNNGPSIVTLNDECAPFLSRPNNDVKLFNYTENRPLSVIYNECLSVSDYDKYVFFDDDSSFERDYFDEPQNFAMIDEKVDLLLPQIIDKTTGGVTYPRGVKLGDYEAGFIFPQDNYFYSIGSGLIIYKSLIDKFNNYNLSLFDERFALYGVDLSLFRRIERLKKQNVVIKAMVTGKIFHLLSSTSEKMTEWRYRERLYDKVLSIKYYSKNHFRLIAGLAKAILIEIYNVNFKNVYHIFSVFIRGKHPRT
ncbi:glycosyltransferase family 2 protein [Klebsiella pneumoniae]|uniref:glycosyltransferase family 2 protein n=1 Tax=Klebsiella pneumoniae TaxID=573 RepID=UPI001F1CF945|nr:glycosyltransferase [Klebsiella pneumoniae]MCE7492400.1 hypothetical protein [Klebsiella pneumoniae]MCE7502894.1 hypothetical protein [Klebsiella pneumoniae]MCQ8639718.1 glycosyltransferase [Klebsiella pneumoniae]